MVGFCPNNTQDKSTLTPIEPPNLPPLMICIKTLKKSSISREPEVKRVKKSKSRELRASILYVGCDCERRYGLQDDCLRSDCHGAPECLVKPDPICGPSEFANAKHLAKKFDKSYRDNAVSKDVVTFECFPIPLTKILPIV